MYRAYLEANIVKCLLDILAVSISANLASQIYFGVPVYELHPIYLNSTYIASLLTIYFFSKIELYSSWRGKSPSLMLFHIAITWIAVLSLLLLFGYLIHQSSVLSRIWMACWFAIGISILFSYRFAVYSVLSWMRKNGLNVKRVMLVGFGASGMEIYKRALRNNRYGYDIISIHCNAGERHLINDPKITIVENLDSIPHFVKTQKIDEVWLALQTTEYVKLERLHFLLRNALVDVRWIPDTPGIRMVSRRATDFLGMLSVDLNSPEAVGIRGMGKEAFDRLFSILVLLALSIPFVAIAIAIKCSSPGPVFFRQIRHGLNGRKFQIYKFRTMIVHSEFQKITQATNDDIRVTRIGRLLRRTSIDELPQFINVLMGDMSIVGPRPHALEHNEFYEDKLEIYMLRHRVKPGITGLAQMHGFRGETATLEKMHQRVDLDLQYIMHWSLFLDLKIVLWTAIKGWSGKNVY